MPPARWRSIKRRSKREPSSAAARAALERQLSGELKSQAATILVPIYERAGEWARLADAHEMLASTAEGEALVDNLRTLGQIREDKLSDAAGALEAFTRRCGPRPPISRSTRGWKNWPSRSMTGPSW